MGLKPTFKFLYEFLGKVFATSTKCKSYELENHESDALSQQSDDLMVEFFPNIQSRWIKLVVFIGSIVGIFGKKYLDHLEMIKKQKSEKNVVDVEVIQSSNEFNNDSIIPINPMKRF